jgi:hypothetical protein
MRPSAENAPQTVRRAGLFGLSPAQWAMVALSLAVLWACASIWDYTADDAYITLRYSRNLVDAHAIAWNVGEPPVEGYSNFLFLLLGSLALWLGGDPVLALKAVSTLALLGSAWLLFHLGRQLTNDWFALVAPALLLSDKGSIWWTVSGMETQAYQVALLAAAAFVFRELRHPGHDEASARAWLGAGLGLFVASLLRPEAPVLVFLFALAAWVRRRRLRGSGVVALGLSFGVPYALYFAWRVGYFGEWFPNTVYCKSGYPQDPWAVVRPFWLAWSPWALLALARPWKGYRPVHAVLLGVPLLYTLILVDVNPIVNAYHRHFMAALPFLLLAVGEGIFHAANGVLRRLGGGRIRPVAASAAVALAAIWAVAARLDAAQAAVAGQASQYRLREDARRAVAQALNGRVAPEQSVLIGDVGVVGYYGRFRIDDLYCLNNRRHVEKGRRKSVGDVVGDSLERKPAAIALSSRSAVELRPRGAQQAELVRRAAFAEEYELAEVFPSPSFNYFLYLRREDR